MNPDRRAFLKQVLKGTIYAAPVLRTLSAPDALMAQRTSGKKCPPGQENLDKCVDLVTRVRPSKSPDAGAAQLGPIAPWQVVPGRITPPASNPPGIKPPGS